MRRHKSSKKKTLKSGFTLVELSFAVAFMSVLFLVVAALISSIVASYQKGLSIKSVNSVGRTITEDITGSISNTYSSSLCSGDATPCSSVPTSVFQSRSDSDGNQLYGILCTGTYSYAWYTGHNKDDSDNFNGPYRLLKIQDSNRTVCAKDINSNANDMPNASPDTEELISASEQQLVLYDLTVDAISQEPISNIAFFSGSFTLGTTTGVSIEASGSQCKIEGNTQTLASDFNYCAINKFNFAARTAGG